MRKKDAQPSFDLNVDGWRKESDRLSISLITELQSDDNEIAKE